ncbi:MAG: hypothetical protein ACKVQC_04695 [Elusimicrobiota bacterium]
MPKNHKKLQKDSEMPKKTKRKKVLDFEDEPSEKELRKFKGVPIDFTDEDIEDDTLDNLDSDEEEKY